MSAGKHWSGEYQDDRMYVMRITTDFRKSHDKDSGLDVVETGQSDTVDLESVNISKPALLITYRNVPSLPAVRTDDFQTVQKAIEYAKRIEPTCPRVSLGGQAPKPTPSWQEHQDWLHGLGLRSAIEGDDPVLRKINKYYK